MLVDTMLLVDTMANLLYRVSCVYCELASYARTQTIRCVLDSIPAEFSLNDTVCVTCIHRQPLTSSPRPSIQIITLAYLYV